MQSPLIESEPTGNEGRPTITGIYDEAKRLYDATSSTPFKKNWGYIPEELAKYLEFVYSACNQEIEVSYTELECTHPTIDNGTCWVMFSGGKDCTAAAIRAERMGYKIVCYHQKGINRGVQTEIKHATKICEKMGWRLIINDAHVTGKKHGLIEPPTKNQVTALCMMEEMKKQGGAVWTGGFLATDTIASGTMKWGLNYSDAQDVITLFDKYLEKKYQVKRLQLLEHELESWVECTMKGLLNDISGCTFPSYFKSALIVKNEMKYGNMLDDRCGSCYKCAWEQLALEALGILKPNPELRKHQEKYIMQYAIREGEPMTDIINRLVPQNILKRLL